ncbi:MAG TPA: AMP-binding protein [Thermoclostridium caenicola]|nr:AMP-binding protein [Thermoclostridium caenicola]HOK43051.1 AMP-binding protein [Thermoclostridium caenicola]HOL83855.1 AMP-binding protein [Thermoclostridium caenicola]HPO76366.1 AMP-binding protein [Thermoclostridium caenicola]
MKNYVTEYTQNGRRIIRGVGHYQPKPVSDLKQLVKNCAREYGNRTGFKFKNTQGKIVEKTYVELDQEIDRLGTTLIARGFKGKRLAIISENRYEWGLCYFAIINGTGIGVPLDKYLPKEEIENLVKRGKVEAIFYSRTYHDMMREIAAANDQLKLYICMDDIASDETDARFTTLPRLLEEGQLLLAQGNRSFVDAEIDRNAMSILLFTSGTTSMSKGVMLSHANIAANVTSISGVFKLYPDDVHLSLLPLHHTFENTVGLMFMMHMGVCIAYCQGIKYIADNIREFGVSVMVAVPAIFEAIYARLQDGIRKAGKEGLVKAMTRVSRLLRKVGIDVRRVLFRSILEKLGPRLRMVVSGAAPIPSEIIRGYEDLGITFLQGYGLTETSPVVSTSTEFVNVPGTIGYPITDVEVTIDSPDENGMGEILVRGENVMLGYYEAPEETESAFTQDGWFRTGDLGFADEKGLLTITGRVKSMIVFTNGKKAFPEEYEMLLNRIPGVRESFAWGYRAKDGDIQVCAKLVLDEEYFKSNGNPSIEAIGEMMDAEIRKINNTLPKYKIIRYFVLSKQDLIKTTTLKIRRSHEQERIQKILDAKGLEMRKLSKQIID